MRIIPLIYTLSVLALPLAAQQSSDAIAPEIRTALATKATGAPVQADNWMVVAANPLAVQSGARVLRDGGTAADAMVAVQSVLGLVEPQSSGLGGDANAVSRWDWHAIEIFRCGGGRLVCRHTWNAGLNGRRPDQVGQTGVV